MGLYTRKHTATEEGWVGDNGQSVMTILLIKLIETQVIGGHEDGG